MSLAHSEFVAAIRDDPVALAELRRLLALEATPDDAPARSPGWPPAYTVRSLALELSRSERSVRAAIARGELRRSSGAAAG